MTSPETRKYQFGIGIGTKDKKRPVSEFGFGIRIWAFLFKNLDFRDVCAITDLENGQVIITGGNNAGMPDTMVAVYSEDGYVENLTELNEGRFKHACTSYVSNNGSKVCLHTLNENTVGRLSSFI